MAPGPESPQNNTNFHHPPATNQSMPPYYYNYPQQYHQYPYYPQPHMYPPVQAAPQMYPPHNTGGNYPMMPPSSSGIAPSMQDSQIQKQTHISSPKPVTKKKFKRRPSLHQKSSSPSSIGRSRTISRTSSSYSNTSSVEGQQTEPHQKQEGGGLPPISSSTIIPKARSTCSSNSTSTSDDFNNIIPGSKNHFGDHAGNDSTAKNNVPIAKTGGALPITPETSPVRSLIPIPRLSPATSSSTTSEPPPSILAPGSLISLDNRQNYPSMTTSEKSRRSSIATSTSGGSTSEKCWFRPENISDQVRIVVKPINEEIYNPVFMNLPLYDALKVKAGSTLCMPAAQQKENIQKNIYYTVLDPTIYPADGIPMPEILGLKLQIVYMLSLIHI